jgi:hypothetical protein
VTHYQSADALPTLGALEIGAMKRRLMYTRTPEEEPDERYLVAASIELKLGAPVVIASLLCGALVYAQAPQAPPSQNVIHQGESVFRL